VKKENELNFKLVTRIVRLYDLVHDDIFK